MKEAFSNFVRGINVKRWWWFYQHAQTSSSFFKSIYTALYMRMASTNGGYVGRETIFCGMPILPHGFHGVHISRGAVIGRDVTIYQNVTIGATKEGAPKIGNNVLIGAGAIIVGGVKSAIM